MSESGLQSKVDISGKRKRELSDDAGRASRDKPPGKPAKGSLLDQSIGEMSPALLADHFAKATRRHHKHDSVLELEDRYVPHRFFLDTTSFKQPHALEQFPDFLTKFAGGRESLVQNVTPSSPHTLVICSSGIRAADVTRALRTFKTDQSAIAKLFAKHLKLKETVEYVKKTAFGFGVGTPKRLQDLIENGALRLDALQRVVVDGSYLDDKKRSIFSMKELLDPMLDLVLETDLRQRFDGEARILVF